MKLIIDIPDHVYEWVKNTGKFGMYRFDTAKVIQNGIPLDDVKAEIDQLPDLNPDYPMDKTIHINKWNVMQILANIGKAENKEGEGC